MTPACLIGVFVLAGGPEPPAFTELFRSVGDSIVNVVVFPESVNSPVVDASEPEIRKRVRAVGAGFVWKSGNLVVTNAHVVGEAGAVYIQSGDSPRMHRAELVGTEPRYDLALVQTTAVIAKPLRLAGAEPPPVGTWVAIVGNPLGIGRTLTVGVLGAVGKSIFSDKYEDFLLLSANVNPGNSGGPVVDLRGRVLGVLAMKATGVNVEGLAFAIPAYVVEAVTTQLASKGYFQRVVLGVEVRNLRLAERERRSGGVVIEKVSRGSPAHGAGLRVGEVLEELDGVPIRDTQELASRLLTVTGAQAMRLRVVRPDGEGRTVRVPVALEDDSFLDKKRVVSALELGIRVEPLSPFLRHKWGLDQRATGLLVDRVDAGKKAHRSGMRRGDVIITVNGQPLRSSRELIELLHEASSRDTCQVAILRKGKHVRLTLSLAS